MGRALWKSDASRMNGHGRNGLTAMVGWAGGVFGTGGSINE